MIFPENPVSPLLTEQLGDVYFFRTLDTGSVTYLSETFKSLFGRSRDLAYQDSQDWLQALHPQDRDPVARRLNQHRQNQTPYQDSYRILRPDGTVLPVIQRSWVELSSAAPSRYVSVVQACAEMPLLPNHASQPFIADDALNQLLNSPVVVLVSMRVFSDGHWEWDFFSAGCEFLFGFTVEEMTADPELWLSRVHAEDAEGVIMPLLNSIFASCDRAPHQYRFTRKDGEMRWLQGDLSSRYEPEGDCWRVTIVTTDITQQKDIQGSLEESQRLLQRVTDDLPQILYIFNLQYCCNEYVNPHIEHVLGVDPKILKQSALMEDWFHPEEQATLEQYFQSWQTIPDGVCQQLEYRMRHRNGQWRWLRSREVVFERGAQGQPIKLLGTAVDITDEKQAVADLKDILHSIPVCIGRLRVFENRDFQYDYISPASLSLWGFSPEAIMETPTLWEDRVYPEDLNQKILPLYSSVFACQSAYGEYRYCHPDQGWRWIAVNLTATANTFESSWRVTTVSWDISDRKGLEATLQRQTQQERLLHSITVDMRQSLSLERTLETAVQDVRQFFEADRALIFQLLGDGSGQVIQESVLPEFPVTDKMRWLDEHFPSDCYEHYRQGAPRIVPDITHDEWADCLVEFMQEVGVQSKVVAPIVQKEQEGQAQVWGLLIIHACAQPRVWHQEEAQALQQIADQLAVAIQQTSLYEQLQEANQQLNHLATTDALTQVANRRAFDHYLQQEWQRMVRNQEPIALVLCDIDFFKQYNDTYGHPAGDTCLVQVAHLIAQMAKRPGDFVARYGGEEFVIVLPQTDEEGALHLIGELQSRIDQASIEHLGSPLEQRITLSFGMVWGIPNASLSWEQLLSLADEALYEAKNTGRNIYCRRQLRA